MLTATVSMTVSVMLGAALGPCQPGYFADYPGAEVREALFVDSDLSEEQCRLLEDMTTALHEEMRSMTAEWAYKPVEERRQKVRELYHQHAVRAATIATEEQAERIAINLEGWRERLVGKPPTPRASSDTVRPEVELPVIPPTGDGAHLQV